MFQSTTVRSPAISVAAFRADALASVVVFLVALPLCMGVAIASGAPVATGLISGIIGGIVAGLLAGCPLQVSGPAAGLTVIVMEIIDQLGYEQLGLIVLIAGALQVAAGFGKLGQWFRAVSPAVIKGMLAGIGLLILGSQFHVMLDQKPPGRGAENLNAIPAALAAALTPLSAGDQEARSLRQRVLNESRELLQRQNELARLAREAGTEENAQAVSATQSALTEQISAWRKRVAALSDPTIYEEVQNLEGRQLAVAQALESNDSQALGAAIDSAAESLRLIQGRLRQPNYAGLVGLLTIAVIVLWQEFAPLRLKTLPPALAAVLVASGVVAWWALPVYQVDVPDRLWDGVHLPTAAILGETSWKLVLQYGLLTAIVASAETLLCAAAVDQMQTGPRTKYDQELVAQGVGNLLCGIVGALPISGVIVRSSANVLAGAKTRLSAILHGLWLLAFVTGLSTLLRQIPTSCLAAILVYTGYKLTDIKAIRELRNFGWGEVAIYAVTVAVIVYEDLLTGVMIGIGLSSLKLLYTFSHLRCDLLLHDAERTAQLRLLGAATFVRLPKLAAELERIPVGYELHVDFTELDYIDHACLELLMSWGAGHQATGGSLVLDWESLHGRFRRDARGQPPSE